MVFLDLKIRELGPVFVWFLRHDSCGKRGRNKNAMNTLAAKGNWNIAKGKLKQMVGRLICDPSRLNDGKVDELMGRIQKRAHQARGGRDSMRGSC